MSLLYNCVFFIFACIGFNITMLCAVATFSEDGSCIVKFGQVQEQQNDG